MAVSFHLLAMMTSASDAPQPVPLRPRNRKPNEAKKTVWALESAETIDPLTLFTPEEIAEAAQHKEVPQVCATTKKRRACADCSCGLAEVLQAEKDAGPAQNFTTVDEAVKSSINKPSACGNCYKGDAFRCAGCPSLGKCPSCNPPLAQDPVISCQFLRFASFRARPKGRGRSW